MTNTLKNKVAFGIKALLGIVIACATLMQLGCASTSHEYQMSGVKGLGTKGPVAVLSFVVNGEQNYHPRWLADKEFSSLDMFDSVSARSNRTLHSWLGSVLGQIELIPPAVCDSILLKEHASMSFDSAIAKVARELHCPNVIVLRIRNFRAYTVETQSHGSTQFRDVTVGEANLQLYDDHAHPIWSISSRSSMANSSSGMSNGLLHGDVDSYINFIISEPIWHEIKDMRNN